MSGFAGRFGVPLELRPRSANVTYTYDSSRRLTQDACNQYTYDGFDRQLTNKALSGTGCPTTGPGSSGTVTYTYDGLDRTRTATTTGASPATINRTTNSYYDGLSSQLVGQSGALTPQSGSSYGQATTRYELTATGTPELLAQSGGGQTNLTDLLLTDGTGSITELLNTNGSVDCHADYQPFGDPAGPTPGNDHNGVCDQGGTSTANSLWFNSTQRDQTTGDYQLGTRTYNPNNASFTAPDYYRVSTPGRDLALAADPLTANTYAYVNGNPVNAVDPDGHMFTPGCEGCRGVTRAQARADQVQTQLFSFFSSASVAPPSSDQGNWLTRAASGIASSLGSPSNLISTAVNLNVGLDSAVPSALDGIASLPSLAFNATASVTGLHARLPEQHHLRDIYDRVASKLPFVNTGSRSYKLGNLAGSAALLFVPGPDLAEGTGFAVRASGPVGGRVGALAERVLGRFASRAPATESDSASAAVTALAARAAPATSGASARALEETAGRFAEVGTNSAGGRLIMSDGLINQTHFEAFVNDALEQGQRVHILSGVHGGPDGTLEAERRFFEQDSAAFGLRGANVYDVSKMTPYDVFDVMEKPGTIIGAFCFSAACLTPNLAFPPLK